MQTWNLSFYRGQASLEVGEAPWWAVLGDVAACSLNELLKGKFISPPDILFEIPTHPRRLRDEDTGLGDMWDHSVGTAINTLFTKLVCLPDKYRTFERSVPVDNEWVRNSGMYEDWMDE